MEVLVLYLLSDYSHHQIFQQIDTGYCSVEELQQYKTLRFHIAFKILNNISVCSSVTY